MHDRPALRSLHRCLALDAYTPGLLLCRISLAWTEAERCDDGRTIALCRSLADDLGFADDEDAAAPPCST